MNIHLAAFCSRTLFIYNPIDTIAAYHVSYKIYSTSAKYAKSGIWTEFCISGKVILKRLRET